MKVEKLNIKIPEAISNLTDAEFLSFLYSERDREQSLSQLQGWNNWALAGAFATVLWTVYTICSEKYYIEWTDVVYLTSGILALFITLFSYLRFYERERGIDYSKVRLLKEVFPIYLVSMGLVFSIIFSIFTLVDKGMSVLFWLRTTVAFLFAIAVVSRILYKDRLTPAFADGFMFPWIKVNLWYYPILGGLYGPISYTSFKMSGSGILSNEFGIALCISACVVMYYIYLNLNKGGKVAEQIDIAIDDYVYNGVSREKTYVEILKNRMGYSVMDVCEKDLNEIFNMVEQCEEDIKILSRIKEEVEKGGCIIALFNSLQSEALICLDKQTMVIQRCKKLNQRLREIQKVAVGMNNIAAINAILDEDDKILDEVNAMNDKVKEVVESVRKREDEMKNGRLEENL